MQLFFGTFHGTFIFPNPPVYHWYLSATVVLLNTSYSLHNVIAWIKNKPFLSRKASLFYIITVALAQPYWVLAIVANVRMAKKYLIPLGPILSASSSYTSATSAICIPTPDHTKSSSAIRGGSSPCSTSSGTSSLDTTLVISNSLGSRQGLESCSGLCAFRSASCYSIYWP